MAPLLRRQGGRGRERPRRVDGGRDQEGSRSCGGTVDQIPVSSALSQCLTHYSHRGLGNTKHIPLTRGLIRARQEQADLFLSRSLPLPLSSLSTKTGEEQRERRRGSNTTFWPLFPKHTGARRAPDDVCQGFEGPLSLPLIPLKWFSSVTGAQLAVTSPPDSTACFCPI